jgi:hypothetical protein
MRAAAMRRRLQCAGWSFGLFDDFFFVSASGMITVSMVWMTPLLAARSACTTCALRVPASLARLAGSSKLSSVPSGSFAKAASVGGEHGEGPLALQTVGEAGRLHRGDEGAEVAGAAGEGEQIAGVRLQPGLARQRRLAGVLGPGRRMLLGPGRLDGGGREAFAMTPGCIANVSVADRHGRRLIFSGSP